jgi:glutathione S-transferase
MVEVRGVSTLIGLHYSPWSVRARWALDLRHVPYGWVEHVPMIGEPLLRVRARRLTGRVTVPILIADGTVIEGSLAIAAHADAHGEGPALVPSGARQDIESWNELAEDAMIVARKWVVQRTASDEAVLLASLPRALRSLPGAIASARMGTAFFRKKYVLDALDGAKEPIVRFLDRLRQTVKKHPYVLGDAFTYADVIAATTLQCVRPVKKELWPIEDGLRPAWTDDELAARYGDLLEWRDGIFERHRGLPAHG